jgi:hypothetical protein
MKSRKKNSVKNIERICVICGKDYYANRKTSKFCSDTCKQFCYDLRTQNRNGYNNDVNKGSKLVPGTIPSQQMSESLLVFTGSKEELLSILTSYLSNDQIKVELTYLENIQPIIDTKTWFASSMQIFTNIHLLEVMQINKMTYKLYAYEWESDDEKPFNTNYINN